jgi:G3E family GTPase
VITPLPVTLIGGYLGAGKTTLVNQMLRRADGLKLAVLVNEFGELPIDEDLIEAQNDELISIAGGCICCSFGSDLTAAMLKLAHLSPRPDHIVIEASGVAMPGAIAQSITILPDFRMEGICVLADGIQVQKLAQDEYIGDTIERQLSDADLIVLTKTDLMTSDQITGKKTWIADQWPSTTLVTSKQGSVPNTVLLGQFPPNEGWQTSDHHDQSYDSMILRPCAPVDAAHLAQALEHPQCGIVRAKGYVPDTSGRPALIQVVGQRAEVTFPETVGDFGLVCIGLRDVINREHLKSLVIPALT